MPNINQGTNKIINPLIEFNICQLITFFSHSLTCLELKRISITNNLLLTLNVVIEQLIELSLECPFTFYKTFELLKCLLQKSKHLKYLTLRYIATQYWDIEC
ncbi:unnamed protein product, partial [Didymodactylos carnosus]